MGGWASEQGIERLNTPKGCTHPGRKGGRESSIYSATNHVPPTAHRSHSPAPPPLAADKLAEAVRIRDLLGQNTEELRSVARALNGEYILPEAGGDLLRDGAGELGVGVGEPAVVVVCSGLQHCIVWGMAAWRR